MPNYELIQRGDSPRWYITWSERGRSRRYSTGTENRVQAKRVLAAFIIERESPTKAKPEEITIAAILTEYLDNHAANLPSAWYATIAADHLLGHFGHDPVSALTPIAHQQYEKTRKAAGAKNATINRERAVLRAALNRAYKAGRLESVPHVPTLEPGAPRDRFLTRPEIARLLRECKSLHMRLFVRLAVYTGARHSAITELTWDRVDLERRRVVFSLPGVVHRRKRRATVPVTGALYLALVRAKKRARTKHVIEYGGEQIRSVKKAFERTAKRAKLKRVTPHVLRHTAATLLAAGGVPIYLASGYLAMSEKTLREIYAKHDPSFMADAAVTAMRGTRQTRAKTATRK